MLKKSEEKEVKESEPKKEAKKPSLIPQIVQKVDKKPGETVRAFHLFDDYFRINWYKEDEAVGDLPLLSYKVVRSSFARVTVTNSGIKIEDKTKGQKKTLLKEKVAEKLVAITESVVASKS
jgi:hypothetical protein